MKGFPLAPEERQMKKMMLGIGVGAVLAAVSVHAAYGGSTSTVNVFPGGGNPVNPNPTFHGNCTATLQKYTFDNMATPVSWITVAASTAAECRSLVNGYLSGAHGGIWLASPYTPVCACYSPAMGRLVELGVGTVSWTAEQDATLDGELAELKAEYQIDEYYLRVEQLVEARIQPAEGAR